MAFPQFYTGANIIALGDFTHPADLSPDFFTHWSTITNIGTVTITVENDSTVTLNVRITRFSGADIDIEISASALGVNRSVTVAGAKSLMIQSDAAVGVTGQYVIVQD